MEVSNERLKRGAYWATIAAAVVAIFSLTLGYGQVRGTQIAQRASIRLQREALDFEYESKAVSLLTEYFKLKRESAQATTEPTSEVSHWEDGLCVSIAESIYNLTGGQGAWRSTVQSIILEHRSFINEIGLDCDTFDSGFIQLVRSTIDGKICITKNEKDPKGNRNRALGGFKMGFEDARNLAEIIALSLAGLFFIYKFISGYHFVNLSLQLFCTRHAKPDASDDSLLVVANLSKGDRGSLEIHDAAICVKYNLNSKEEKFFGLERLSYKKKDDQHPNWKAINWQEISEDAPLINLTPGEETQFCACCDVPKDEICKVEVAILGKRKRGGKLGQWKSTCVSFPSNEINGGL